MCASGCGSGGRPTRSPAARGMIFPANRGGASRADDLHLDSRPSCRSLLAAVLATLGPRAATWGKSRPIAGLLSIEGRPAVVDRRALYGDWEGDTVVGRGHRSGAVTLVDRKSGYLLLGKVRDRRAATVREAMVRLFQPLPLRLRKTLTLDNGKEFAEHEQLAAVTALRVYFAKPYCAWQGGTPHVQLTAAVTLTEEDVAVFISYSGETAEVIRAAALAKESGCKSISITKYGESTWSKHVDIPLFTSSTENEIRSGAMSSRITQLNVIDILYLGVASRNYEQSVKYLEQTRKAIKRLGNDCRTRHSATSYNTIYQRSRS